MKSRFPVKEPKPVLVVISVRLEPAEVKRLDELAQSMPGYKRADVARHFIREGLASVDARKNKKKPTL